VELTLSELRKKVGPNASMTKKFHATLPNLEDLTLEQTARIFASQLLPGNLGIEMVLEHLIEVNSMKLKT